MDTDLARLLLLRGPTPTIERQPKLTVCPICLRVLRGAEWVEAEHVIREIRSYELEAPPELHSTVCGLCAESSLSRRAEAAEWAAA
jgi:hypothetical protein